MYYYICSAILIVIYIAALFLMKYFKNQKITNIIFVTLVFALYIGLLIREVVVDGTNDWNYYMTLPTANVSPFMFFTVPIYFILPKKFRRYYLTLVTLLSLGLLLSTVFNSIARARSGIRFIPHFLLDYFAHILLSLWGVYLLRSEQVDLGIKDSLIGGSIIIIVAFIMFILNCILKTSFFGLSIGPDFNIYNLQLVSNPYLSAFIYFLGLTAILVLGYFYQKLIGIIRLKINKYN